MSRVNPENNLEELIEFGFHENVDLELTSEITSELATKIDFKLTELGLNPPEKLLVIVNLYEALIEARTSYISEEYDVDGDLRAEYVESAIDDIFGSYTVIEEVKSDE